MLCQKIPKMWTQEIIVEDLYESGGDNFGCIWEFLHSVKDFQLKLIFKVYMQGNEKN